MLFSHLTSTALRMFRSEFWLWLLFNRSLHAFHTKPLLPLIKSCEAEVKHEVVFSGNTVQFTFLDKRLNEWNHCEASENV